MQIITGKKMLKARFAALFVTLFTLCALSIPSFARPMPVAVAHGTVSLPFYVAQEQGFFGTEGLEVMLVPCRSGVECFGRLTDGTADVATAAEIALVMRSHGHPEVRLFASMATSSHQIKFVARRDAGIHGARDLQGRRIATVGGSSAEYFLSNWLTFRGWSASDVQVFNVAPADILETFRSRKADAVVIWEPLASESLQSTGANGVLIPTERVYTQYFSLMANRTTIAERQADIRRLLRVLVKAETFIANRPADARRLLMARLGLDASTAERLLAEQDYRVRLDQSLVTTLRAEMRWARQQRLVPAEAKVDASLLISTEALRSVAPEAVTVLDR